MANTPRLGMSLLSSGQAQKEVTHNEAVILLDAIVHACSVGPPANLPPAAPQEGLCYICGTAPSGAWTGKANHVACWTNGGWRFVPPVQGLKLSDQASGREWRFAGDAWVLGVMQAAEVHINNQKVLSARQPAIAAPSGGPTVDLECRSALAQVLQALRSHGLIASPSEAEKTQGSAFSLRENKQEASRWVAFY